MTRSRLLVVAAILWLGILGVLLQPQHHAVPHISPARPLESPPRDLPTLAP